MDQKKIFKAVEILRSIPDEEQNPLEKACMCNRKINILEHSVKIYTGIINLVESICPSCRKEIRGRSKLVCLGCKTLIGYVKPEKHASGFKYEPDKCYHTRTCFKCVPGNYATSVLELEAYCRERHIPTNVDQDRTKEYEKKAGQVDAAASRLRSTLEEKRPNNTTQ